MILGGINKKFRKIIKIIREEGLLGFVKRIISLFFSFGSFYIYEKPTKDFKQLPKIEKYELKIIPTLEELNKFEKSGYNLELMNLEKRIKKGAIAFCIFSGKDLAHVTWVATNREAMKSIDRIPFKINFQEGEAGSGGSLTEPSHRGKGLLNYAYSYILPYLSNAGFQKVKFSIGVDNTSSQKGAAKFSPTMIGKGIYFKILWMDIWKEKPLKAVSK